MKVLLVDDENHILEYLKHLIRWPDFGYDTVLTATSGQAASELLQQEQPALLITDIRMPEVSGLDLARLVTTKKLATQVVILSGYSEFDYAQQALRYGVVDYLLKPVLQPDLEKVVRHVAQLRQENFDLNNTRPLQLWLAALTSLPQAVPDCNLIYPALVRDDYAWRLLPPQQIADIPALVTVPLTAHMLLLTNEEVGLPIVLVTTQKDTHQALFQYLFGELPADYHYFPGDKRNINYFLQMQTINKQEQDTVVFNQLFIDLVALINGHNPGLLKDLGINDLWHVTAGRLQANMPLLADRIQSFFQQDRSIEVVAHVKQYITANLGDDVTLDKLGDLVHLHPVYLSRLFKKEAGTTIGQFTVDVRMERAAALLVESNLRVEDISRMVGYNETQYFIRVFKRHYGLTPKQYREIKTMQGDQGHGIGTSL